MARIAVSLLGFTSALGWMWLLFAAGSRLGSSLEEPELGWIFAMGVLGPLPLAVALALRRGDTCARPLRALCGAGLAIGGYLALLVMIVALVAPFLLFHPAGWAMVTALFLVPTVVWPLIPRRPAARRGPSAR